MIRRARNLVGLYVAANGTVLPNYKMPAADIADNLTIDVEFAIGLQVALYIDSGVDEGALRQTVLGGLHEARSIELGSGDDRLNRICCGATETRPFVEDHERLCK
jgi:hypothetical protein